MGEMVLLHPMIFGIVWLYTYRATLKEIVTVSRSMDWWIRHLFVIHVIQYQKSDILGEIRNIKYVLFFGVVLHNRTKRVAKCVMPVLDSTLGPHLVHRAADLLETRTRLTREDYRRGVRGRVGEGAATGRCRGMYTYIHKSYHISFSTVPKSYGPGSPHMIFGIA